MIGVLHKIISLFLLITTPLTLLIPSRAWSFQSVSYAEPIPNLSALSSKQLLTLIGQIESGELEDNCTEKEHEQISDLVMTLAAIGSDDEELSQRALAYFFEHDKETIELCSYFKDKWQATKDFCKERWDKTKTFVKKHKRKIIIGTVVVIVATILIVIMLKKDKEQSNSSLQQALKSPESSSEDKQFLISRIYKETKELDKLLGEEKEEGSPQYATFSEEKNDEIRSSFLAHRIFQKMERDLGLSDGSTLVHLSHEKIDKEFSTQDTSFFLENKNEDPVPLFYQYRGEKALDEGYHEQALHDFNQSIDNNPDNADLYLDRAVTHLKLGNQEESQSDYQKYEEKTLVNTTLEFTNGFVSGLPDGLYDSGKETFSFVSDLARHPIRTTQEVIESFSELSKLVQSQEWQTLAKSLVPEVSELVEKWDTLPPYEKGELSGYVFGKYGGDILIAGGGAKVAGKASRGMREIKKTGRSLKKAEKILVVETAVGTDSGVIISEAKTAKVLEEGTSYSSRPSTTVNNNGWVLPKEGGGAFINDRWYTEHALERMAPRTPEVMAELEKRFKRRAQVAAKTLGEKEFQDWRLKNAPKPRGIPPSIIEAEIANPGSTGVCVTINEKGDVVTVIPRGK